MSIVLKFDAREFEDYLGLVGKTLPIEMSRAARVIGYLGKDVWVDSVLDAGVKNFKDRKIFKGFHFRTKGRGKTDQEVTFYHDYQFPFILEAGARRSPGRYVPAIDKRLVHRKRRKTLKRKSDVYRDSIRKYVKGVMGKDVKVYFQKKKGKRVSFPKYISLKQVGRGKKNLFIETWKGTEKWTPGKIMWERVGKTPTRRVPGKIVSFKREIWKSPKETIMALHEVDRVARTGTFITQTKEGLQTLGKPSWKVKLTPSLEGISAEGVMKMLSQQWKMRDIGWHPGFKPRKVITTFNREFNKVLDSEKEKIMKRILRLR